MPVWQLFAPEGAYTTMILHVPGRGYESELHVENVPYVGAGL